MIETVRIAARGILILNMKLVKIPPDIMADAGQRVSENSGLDWFLKAPGNLEFIQSCIIRNHDKTAGSELVFDSFCQ